MALNYAFSVHMYAPELNKIYYKGADITKSFGNVAKRLNRDYDRNLRFLRTFIPSIDYMTFLCYEIKKEYSDPKYQSYNRSYKGLVTSRENLLEFKRDMQDKCLKDAKCIFTAKRIYKL